MIYIEGNFFFLRLTTISRKTIEPESWEENITHYHSLKLPHDLIVFVNTEQLFKNFLRYIKVGQ